MLLSVQHPSGIKFTYQYQQINLPNLKNKQDTLNKFYDSYGEPGTFCDMEDIEDTQDFYEYSLPDVFNPDSGIVFSCYEDSEYVAEGGDKSNP